MIEVGKSYKFEYPNAYQLYPEHRAHSGQIVTVVKQLVDGVDYGPMDNPENMYRVRADDGWEGDVWEDELIEN